MRARAPPSGSTCRCGWASTPARWSSPAWPSGRRGSSWSSARPPTAPPGCRRPPAPAPCCSRPTPPGRSPASSGCAGCPGLRLKGIDGPVDAYVVVAGDREGYWPETRGVEGVVTRTIGREQQLRQLQDAFAAVVSERARRIVTVLGRGRRRQVAAGARHRHLAGPAADRRLGAARPGLARPPRTCRTRCCAASSPSASASAATDAPGPGPREVARGLGPAARHRRGRGRRPGDGRHLARVHRRRGGPQRRPAPPTRSRCGGGGAGWSSGCSTGSPSGRRSWCCWRTCTGPTPPAWTRWRPWPRRPRGGPLLVLATARPDAARAAPDLGAAAGRCTPGCSSTRCRTTTRAAWSPRSCSGPTTCRRPWSTWWSAPPTATRTTSRNSSSGWSRRASSTPPPTAGGWRRGPSARCACPTTLRGLLQARLDSLEVAERAVIGGAAVVGRVFWDQAVARLAAVARRAGPRTSPSTRLAAREVVFPRPHSTFSGSREFSFRHALMRDVAYEGVLRSVRRRHHAVAAQWLEEAVAQQRPPRRARRRGRAPPRGGRASGRGRALVPARRPARGQHLLRGRRAAAAHPRPCAGAEGRARPVVRRPARQGGGARPDGPRARSSGRRWTSSAPRMPSTPARKAQVRLAEGRWLFFRGEYPAVPPVAEEAAELARLGRPAPTWSPTP